MTNRRNFLAGFAALLAAPVVFKALPGVTPNVPIVPQPSNIGGLAAYDLEPAAKYIYSIEAIGPRHAIDISNFDDPVLESYYMPGPLRARIKSSLTDTENLVAEIEKRFSLRIHDWFEESYTVVARDDQPVHRVTDIAFSKVEYIG